MAISKVALAAIALVEDSVIHDIRLAAASLAAFPARLYQTEAVLLGRQIDAPTIEQACDALLNEAKPIGDIRSTAEYRKRVAGNLLADFLASLHTEAPSE